MYEKFFKRVIDFILSFLALAVLSPVMLVLIIVGAVAMKGNPFFTQKRPGKINKKTGEEKIFKLIKFRTMSNKKDKNGNLLPDEQRLNGYGRFLRSTSLDELPELWNILKGDMSLVGPRPLLISYIPYYTQTERMRHDVRPGLTGLAQVNGRNFVSWDNRLAYDVQYVENITFFVDVKIIFMTAFQFVKKQDVAVDTNKVEPNFAAERQAKMQGSQEVHL
ncbi:MAG: sugar transferase [Clostridia bacterium]|nr:sugar transferase [Clostridia bacterium]